MKQTCRFCSIIKNQEKIYGEIDTVFLESEKFFSLVSIGAFIKGWTLLITKEHKYNLKKNYEEEAFYEYLTKHISYIRKSMQWSDQIIVFEHGANTCNSETACGTNHAHLHILPFKDSILSEIKPKKSWVKCQWSEVPSIVGNKEYLLYCEKPENREKASVFVHIVEVPESQFFRKIIFKKSDLKGSYSYKEDLCVQKSMETVALLKR